MHPTIRCYGLRRKRLSYLSSAAVAHRDRQRWFCVGGSKQIGATQKIAPLGLPGKGHNDGWNAAGSRRDAREGKHDVMVDASRAEMLQSELTRFIDIVVSELRPRRIVVFGSLASGRIEEWSDLDVVVVMETDLPFLDRLRLIQRRVRPRLAMDLLVYTPEEWVEITRTRPFVRTEIASKGRVVYKESRAALA